jgi:hypothetical protein
MVMEKKLIKQKQSFHFRLKNESKILYIQKEDPYNFFFFYNPAAKEKMGKVKILLGPKPLLFS